MRLRLAGYEGIEITKLESDLTNGRFCIFVSDDLI